jgi:hypothetical protein
MQLEAGGEGAQLAIDYANVYTTKSLGGRYAPNRLHELNNIHVASANFDCLLLASWEQEIPLILCYPHLHRHFQWEYLLLLLLLLRFPSPESVYLGI